MTTAGGESGAIPMLRTFSGVVAIAACLLVATTAADAAVQGKRQVNRPWHGYGFLPGYRTPEQLDQAAYRSRALGYWYGGPGFYRGRWNGGGLGPCWTKTPIGSMWNCG
jgi:hypothetical protein